MALSMSRAMSTASSLSTRYPARASTESRRLCQHLAFAGGVSAWSSTGKVPLLGAERPARAAFSATDHRRSTVFVASRAAHAVNPAGSGRKRAVNADNFVVATEERIVSTTYELELVPVVLIQQGLARRPAISELDIEPCTTRLLARRSFEISNRSMGALLASRVERF